MYILIFNPPDKFGDGPDRCYPHRTEEGPEGRAVHDSPRDRKLKSGRVRVQIQGWETSGSLAKINYSLVQLKEYIFSACYATSWASLVAQRLKRLPPMQETQVWSLGQEDPLEKEMVTHSSTLAWRIPWTEEPSRLQSMGSQRVGHNWVASLSLSWHFMGQVQKMRGPTQVEQHHWLNGHEFEQSPEDSEGQGGLQSMGSPQVGHGLATQVKSAGS